MKKAEKLSLFFSNEFPFNKEGLEEFVNTFAIKSYQKGAIILENGAVENELRFLDQGIIREYYATNDKEKTSIFLPMLVLLPIFLPLPMQRQPKSIKNV